MAARKDSDPGESAKRFSKRTPAPAKPAAAFALLELELGQLRPAHVGLRLVLVRRVLVEVRAALRAQAGAVRAAGELGGQRQRERVAGPRLEVELLAHVGRQQV